MASNLEAPEWKPHPGHPDDVSNNSHEINPLLSRDEDDDDHSATDSQDSKELAISDIPRQLDFGSKNYSRPSMYTDDDDEETELLGHLSGAGEAPLLHVLRRFQRTLRQNGLREEARAIITDAEAQFAAFLRRSRTDKTEILKGTDLLLKDGFRKYLQYTAPILPNIYPKASGMEFARY